MTDARRAALGDPELALVLSAAALTEIETARLLERGGRTVRRGVADFGEDRRRARRTHHIGDALHGVIALALDEGPHAFADAGDASALAKELGHQSSKP